MKQHLILVFFIFLLCSCAPDQNISIDTPTSTLTLATETEPATHTTQAAPTTTPLVLDNITNVEGVEERLVFSTSNQYFPTYTCLSLGVEGKIYLRNEDTEDFTIIEAENRIFIHPVWSPNHSLLAYLEINPNVETQRGTGLETNTITYFDSESLVIYNPDTEKSSTIPLVPGTRSDVLQAGGSCYHSRGVTEIFGFSPDNKWVAMDRLDFDRSYILLVNIQNPDLYFEIENREWIRYYLDKGQQSICGEIFIKNLRISNTCFFN